MCRLDLSMLGKCCTFALANEKDIEQHSLLGDLRHVVRVVAAAVVAALSVQRPAVCHHRLRAALPPRRDQQEPECRLSRQEREGNQKTADAVLPPLLRHPGRDGEIHVHLR